MNYTKQPCSIDQQISLLEQRGLLIADKVKAEHYLSHIGYFRLSGYCKYYQHFLTSTFHQGTTFEQIVDVYIFDRKLRLLMLDVIEKIEVSLKAQISNYMSIKYGMFWYTNSDLFDLMAVNEKKEKIYDLMIEIINKKKFKSASPFVKSYNQKYIHENYLPSRMIFEELTIGEVGTMYNLLNEKDAKVIAGFFDTYFVDLKRWIQVIVVIRNICAHHARLRNRKYSVKPRRKDVILKDFYLIELSENNTEEVIPNMFNASLIIHYLLNYISPNHDFVHKLNQLFEEFPLISKEAMGFPDDRKQRIQII